MTRFGSVRVRVTVVAILAVAVVLLVAGVTLVRTQRRALTEDLDDQLRAVAADLQADLESGEELPPSVSVGGDDDSAAQVVQGSEVVAATTNVEGAPAFVDNAGDRSGVDSVDGLPHDSAEFRVAALPVDGPDDEATLLVAASLDDIDDSVAALVRSLVVTAPIVLAALAGLVFWVVGRTLRPVEEANRRQQRFVADASHELRSPLTRIRSELEVDLAHPDRAEPLETHRSVLEETERLQRLVDDLLQLARSDAGVTAGRTGAVDLDDLVLAEADRLRAEGRVAVDLSAVSAAQVTGQPADLARAVRNLADNAGRHARSRVTFGVTEANGTAMLSVSDDGPGIPAGERERVFERFARVDDARSPTAGGTGLGLAIARDIVERHGGSIAVDPDHVGGARFVVRLPAAR